MCSTEKEQASSDPEEDVPATMEELRDWLKLMTEQGIAATQLSTDQVVAVIEAAVTYNKALPTLLKINKPVVVVGDIHGHLEALLKVFDNGGGRPTEQGPQYLFLGDFVDRGTHSVEVITQLLLSQLVYPQQVHLLRGNHETKELNFKCGFKEEVYRKYPRNERAMIYAGFNHLFAHLPLAALVDNDVLCMHGGIPSGQSDLKAIEQVARPIQGTSYGNDIVDDLLWSDPTDEQLITGFAFNTKRFAGHLFTEGALMKMMAATGVRLVVRAHQVKPLGYEFAFSNRLLTIFSSYGYCGMQNQAAIAVLNNDGGLPKISVYGKDGQEDAQIPVDAQLKDVEDDAREQKPSKRRDNIQPGVNMVTGKDSEPPLSSMNEQPAKM